MARYLVAASRCAEYAHLGDALGELRERADLADFERRVRGRTVLVKPNVIGPFRPAQAATTHPDLVRAVVRWLRDAGADVTVGDNCGVGGYGLNERSARVCGVVEASEGAYRNLAGDVTPVEVDSRYFNELVVSRAFLESDFVVSLPKLKTHSLTLMTLGIKNMFGMLAGTSKSRIHRCAPRLEDFGQALADIYAIRPPDLTILDGVVGMDGSGPSHGRVRPFGYLLASRNAAALDWAVAGAAGVEPDSVLHLRRVRERGLGPGGSGEIDLRGELDAFPEMRLPETLVRRGWLGSLVNRTLYRPILHSRLRLDPRLCNRCRSCIEACPRETIELRDDYPRIDQARCIRCLCCHELCPQGAWQVAGPLRRLMGRQL